MKKFTGISFRLLNTMTTIFDQINVEELLRSKRRRSDRNVEEVSKEKQRDNIRFTKTVQRKIGERKAKKEQKEKNRKKDENK